MHSREGAFQQGKNIDRCRAGALQAWCPEANLLRPFSIPSMLLSPVILLGFLIYTLCSVPTVISQSVHVRVKPCFGIDGNIHRSQLHPMYSGMAYVLKTELGGIRLSNERDFRPQNSPLACAFAFALPDHPLFQFVSVFIKRLEVNFTEGPGGGKVDLVFMGHSVSTGPLSLIQLSKSAPMYHNVYLNTQTWPRNISAVYMFLMHDSEASGARFHLEMSLTPTYLCLMANYQGPGSHVNQRNPYDVSIMSLGEIFHPGWLVCSNPVSASQFGLTMPYRFAAYCIDYRLSCDGIVNCPRVPPTESDRAVPSPAPSLSVDEYSRGLICYSPTVNWFLVAVVIFSIVNIALLFLLSYLGVLRRYSPARYQHLVSSIIRCMCCCLPGRWRRRVARRAQRFEHITPNSSDFDLPLSPPTYESVERADKSNQEDQQQQKMKRLPRRRRHGNEVVVARSEHHLPPSYSEVDENELGVTPYAVIEAMKDLRSMPSRTSRQRHHSPNRLKPVPAYLREARNQDSLMHELGVLLRQTTSRARALFTSGLQARRTRLQNRRVEEQTGASNPRSTAPVSQDTPLPNYFQFLSGDYPRYPSEVEVDYIQPPQSRRTRGHFRRYRRHRHPRMRRRHL